jgi:hypothetical protein
MAVISAQAIGQIIEQVLGIVIVPASGWPWAGARTWAAAVMLPLSFLAGAFVPIAGMKLIPRVITEWDPLSALVAAVRQVCQGTHSSGSLQLDHPVPAMIAWCVLLIAVCVPLARPLPDRERLTLGGSAIMGRCRHDARSGWWPARWPAGLLPGWEELIACGSPKRGPCRCCRSPRR